MRKILILGLLVLNTIAFSYSQAKDTIVYDGDPKINQWVIDNMDDLKKMTRAEFLKLENHDYQFAALGVFSPEQKMEIWKGKIDQVLSLDVWNDLEREHIKRLYVMIDDNRSWFENDSLKTEEAVAAQEEAIMKNGYLWCKYAVETLKWTNDFAYILVSDPNDAIIVDGKVQPSTRARKNGCVQSGACGMQ